MLVDVGVEERRAETGSLLPSMEAESSVFEEMREAAYARDERGPDEGRDGDDEAPALAILAAAGCCCWSRSMPLGEDDDDAVTAAAALAYWRNAELSN